MFNSYKNLIHRGGIYWIETNPKKPTIGHMMQQNRPGIVVSSDANNKNLGTVMVVFLTSAPRQENDAHCVITTAIKPSTALCEQVTTIDKSQLGNYIGTATEDEMAEIQEAISSALGFEWEEDDTIRTGTDAELSECQEEYHKLMEKYDYILRKYDRLRDFVKDLL